MKSAKANSWRSWKCKASGFAWSAAVIGTASAGFFTGLDFNAHSDIAKFSAQLAQHERVPGEVIVKLAKSNKLSTQSVAASLMGQFNISAMKAFETNDSFYKVKLARDSDTANFLEAASHNPAIQYAEPNYIMHAMVDAPDSEEVIPNDPEFDKLWSLKNAGQKDSSGQAGVVGADIGATKAWKTTTGNKDILVAIIDTGVDYTHPDLVDNIYTNPGESGDGKETNGIDDDGNGFVDDFHGWNFAGVSTNNPMDDNEHGTHVAGTIGAKGNDGKGIVGINWTTSIMPVKFLTGEGSGTLEDAVKAIQYATKMGAKVMNNSWGGGGFTQTMMDSIVEAKNKGLLFVAAAGNDSQNADSSPHYPAGYQVDNVIAVASTDNKDTLSSFSTFGKRTVHIAAPGGKIFSSVPGGKYDTFSGTSMATPHVVGAAALLWGTNPAMSYTEVKDRILRSRDFVPSLSRKVASSGRLNVNNAIMGIYPPSPEPAESAWVDFPLSAPIESAHPYANAANQTWSIQGPANAKFMRVVFAKIDLENGYDFVKVLDANGAEMDSISGSSEGQASFYVTGSAATIKLTSDGSVNKWGFSVAKVQVVY